MKAAKIGVLAIALSLVTTGCFGTSFSFSNPMDVFMLFLGGALPTTKGPVKSTVETSVGVGITGEIGGLDGTYDLTFSPVNEGPAYGTLSGTTKVKGGRFIKIVDKGTDDLMAIVAAMAAEQAGGDVTITKAKGKLKGFQVPGGAQSTFNFSVKFKGTVTSGPRAGATIKKGKISAADTIDNF